MSARTLPWDPTTVLSRRDRPLHVYFRDDDAGWDDAALMQLLDRFAHHAVPIDLALIPAALTDELTLRLTAAAVRQPLGIHQHGFRHVNHEPSGRKCEFGPSRDACAQARDIGAGATLLQASLGTLVQPLFTPPWNRCTQATAAALSRLGFRALSRDAGAESLDTGNLDTLPVHLDWQKRAQRSESFTAALATSDTIGIMLHHAVMDEQDHADLDHLIAALRAQHSVRFTAMGALLAE